MASLPFVSWHFLKILAMSCWHTNFCSWFLGIIRCLLFTTSMPRNIYECMSIRFDSNTSVCNNLFSSGNFRCRWQTLLHCTDTLQLRRKHTSNSSSWIFRYDSYYRPNIYIGGVLKVTYTICAYVTLITFGRSRHLSVCSVLCRNGTIRVQFA